MNLIHNLKGHRYDLIQILNTANLGNNDLFNIKKTDLNKDEVNKIISILLENEFEMEFYSPSYGVVNGLLSFNIKDLHSNVLIWPKEIKI